jgi:hypothetical protein
MEEPMGRISMGRVVIGGLVAGLIINLCMAMLHGVLLTHDWQAAMLSLGRSMQTGGQVRSLVIFNVQGFLAGLFGVWLYAAIRPRFGAGPGTAVRAGIALWFGCSFLPALIQMALGILPDKLIYLPLAADFVIVIAALLAGAALYREAE